EIGRNDSRACVFGGYFFSLCFSWLTFLSAIGVWYTMDSFFCMTRSDSKYWWLLEGLLVWASLGMVEAYLMICASENGELVRIHRSLRFSFVALHRVMTCNYGYQRINIPVPFYSGFFWLDMKLS